MDIDREPDGLYFYPGDFWSLIQGPGDDPELVVEEAREESIAQEVGPVSMELEERKSAPISVGDPTLGAVSGLPPILSSHESLQPNMVYTIPPPPASVFYSREVIERARKLNLHPSQEHMRYAVAQSLTHNDRKHSSRSGRNVLSKLRKLGSSRR